MVGTAGFEPTTPWSQARCSTKLSHVPILQGWTDELPARPGAGSEIRTRTLLVLSQAPLPIGLLRQRGGEGNRTLAVLLAKQVPDQHEQRPHGPAGPVTLPGRRTKARADFHDGAWRSDLFGGSMKLSRSMCRAHELNRSASTGSRSAGNRTRICGFGDRRHFRWTTLHRVSYSPAPPRNTRAAPFRKRLPGDLGLVIPATSGVPPAGWLSLLATPWVHTTGALTHQRLALCTSEQRVRAVWSSAYMIAHTAAQGGPQAR